MQFIEKVAATIERHKLLKARDSILVALSGGPDSVALLDALVKIRSGYNLRLFAVYINHQIRLRAAKREMAFCRKLCRRLGVKLVFVEENIPELSRSKRAGIEETARDFRYEQFEKLSEKLNCNRIALGHHVDDRVETLLFRLFRGTGLTGLKSIPVKRRKYIRPLFDITKLEIMQYLRKNRLKFCVDRSNLESEYKRNFIRNKLLPLIRQNINKNADKAILNLIDTISEEDDFLEKNVDRLFDRSVSTTRMGKLVLALKHFDDYDLWIQRRLIRHCIVKASGLKQFPDKETVQRVLELAKGKAKAVTISGEVQCIRRKDEIYFTKSKNSGFASQLAEDGVTEIGKLGSLSLRISSGSLKNKVTTIRNSNKVIVDFDKLSWPLLARNINRGDRFRPLGLGGTKKVGDYLTDRKINVLTRDEIPIVADKKGIIWLVGFEIDERVKIDRSTKKALEIEFTPADKPQNAAI
jgi:tRNA(Ile)-lysidine synthase